jgi:long-chain acyl-CoA synthetase
MADRSNPDSGNPKLGTHHIATVAMAMPDHPAVIAGGTGSIITYAELDLRSRKLAGYLSANRIAKGDHIAIMMAHSRDYLAVCWAAQRLGLVYTPINWHLTPPEIAHILENSDAKALVVSDHVHPALEIISQNLRGIVVGLTTGPSFGAFKNLNHILERVDDNPDLGYHEGNIMFYSSGTTGRPKGIARKQGEIAWGNFAPLDLYLRTTYGLDRDTVYLVPAPLYHAAALVWAMNVLRGGGTVVVMERFDPLEALRLIEAHRVTHAQFVPTMFVRMLRLSEDDRARYSLSTLKCVLHAAAPCPVQIKHQMIDWLGPVIHEYYAGSERNGLVAVDSATWAARPGTVGRAVFGQIHIVDEAGRELPAGQDGLIYFSGTNEFEYYKDPIQTASAFNELGWSTLGDLGHLDDDGFLFLADRRTDLIISGGVNIYPKEVEDALIQHPAVADVAVIGLPNVEYGQEVRAVVELHAGISPGSQLAEELVAFCRLRIAAFKCPKSVDFATLPRLPNGKMLKRQIRDQYLAPRRSMEPSQENNI